MLKYFNLTSVVEYEDNGQPSVMLKINSKAEFAEEGTYFLIPQFFKLKYQQVKLEIKTEKNGQKRYL